MKSIKEIDSKINILPNGCWEWIGCISQYGYGLIYFKGRQRLAHRIMYEHKQDVVLSSDIFLDHKCHDPEFCTGGNSCLHRRCVNPDHLEPSNHERNNHPSRSCSDASAARRARRINIAYRRAHGLPNTKAAVSPDAAWRPHKRDREGNQIPAGIKKTRNGRWRVRRALNNIHYNLGTFKTREEAEKASLEWTPSSEQRSEIRKKTPIGILEHWVHSHGSDIASICKRLGVKRKTLLRVATGHNVSAASTNALLEVECPIIPRKKEFTERVFKFDWSKAVEMYTAGSTLIETAKSCHCTEQGIWYALRKLGIKRRPSGRQKRPQV